MKKMLPVLISIAIIITVALLRERSRTLAAVLVTLPINIPLSMWIVARGNAGNTKIIYDFARSTVIGMGITQVWILIVFFALRAGWTLPAALASAYGVWIVLIAVLFMSRVLSL